MLVGGSVRSGLGGGTVDERLDAGRHHLMNGERALRSGYVDESRSHFEAALLQFRGPELRLGEAHSLRGLAEVELMCGNVALAEETARVAAAAYRDLREMLPHIDPDGVSGGLGRDAEEGEAASLVLVGDLLMRSGKLGEARETLAYARAMFGGLGDVPSAASVWMAVGRLEAREGRLAEAHTALQKAVSIHERSGDLSGQCSAWLAIAETCRAEGRTDDAERHLVRAVSLAGDARDGALEGRAMAAMGSLLLQEKRLEDARAAFEGALPRIREGGDTQAEAYALIELGDVRTRMGDVTALELLADGGRLLGTLGNTHGVGAAMFRVAAHGLRFHQLAFSLAASESARQLWQVTDPLRGVGQALRLQVKALAALKLWPAAVTVAYARAARVGELQGNAIVVRDFYRARARPEAVEELDALDAEGLELRAEAMVARVLEPVMEHLELDITSLGTLGGAIAVIEAIVENAPTASDAEAEPSVEPAPPDDDTHFDLHPPEDVPVAASEESPSGPPPAPGYEGLYSPPSAALNPFDEDAFDEDAFDDDADAGEEQQ